MKDKKEVGNCQLGSRIYFINIIRSAYFYEPLNVKQPLLTKYQLW